MANHCSNYILLTGFPDDLKAFNDYIVETNKLITEGHSLDEFQSKVSELEFFYTEGHSTSSLSFITNWNPILDEVIALVRKYNLLFVYYFEELGNSLYGAYVSKANSFFTECVQLDDADFDRVIFWDKDEDSNVNYDHYTLDGMEISNDLEAYEILLERKLKRKNLI